ncbi:serine hydrolase domain-containing protein [Nonomuraea sp. NPDC000554]|uniref:serine hydrolase domain-containing protein n=1 Tax=Nonomuraea sp. NPDC000554 TaxID=3154259 RepID=UPI0033193430
MLGSVTFRHQAGSPLVRLFTAMSPACTRLLALATVGAVAAGTLGLGTAAASAATRTGPDDVVQTSLNKLVRTGDFPGVVAAVQGRDGRVRDYTAGVADLGTRAKVPVNGTVRIGSHTKTFAAAVVLQLAGEGKLDLDARIEKYLPGVVRGNGNDGRGITSRQLLQHTSGLPEYTDFSTLFDIRHTYFEPRDLIDKALGQKPQFAPGKAWTYNNTGYVLLGLIVQKVTGRPMGDEVTNRIIKPLGLRDTYWPRVGEQTIRGTHPNGYHANKSGELVKFTRMDPSWGWTSGNLISTPRDVTRFLGALLGGKLLKPAQLKEMKRTIEAPALPPGWEYGLGLMKIKLSCGGYAWGHGGDIPGYETRNGITEDGRSATLTVTALPTSDAAAQRVDSTLDTLLCAQS